MRVFGTQSPVRRLLGMQGHTVASLATLNRPGAWLLDYAYTVIRVLYREAQTSSSYSVIPNSAHLTLFQWCFEEHAASEHGSSSNNRGNQMELLGWLAVEADRPELVLAQAFHSRKAERAAERSANGYATDSSEDNDLPPDQEQLWLQEFEEDVGCPLASTPPAARTSPPPAHGAGRREGGADPPAHPSHLGPGPIQLPLGGPPPGASVFGTPATRNLLLPTRVHSPSGPASSSWEAPAYFGPR